MSAARPKSGVLLVDDDAAVRAVLEAAVVHLGFPVWSAATGLEALGVYARHQDAIAIVLLDIQMPELDGVQTLGALRRLDPNLPCCFLSGNAGSYDADQLRALGARYVLAKPVRIHELGKVLAGCLRSVSKPREQRERATLTGEGLSPGEETVPASGQPTEDACGAPPAFEVQP